MKSENQPNSQQTFLQVLENKDKSLYEKLKYTLENINELTFQDIALAYETFPCEVRVNEESNYLEYGLLNYEGIFNVKQETSIEYEPFKSKDEAKKANDKLGNFKKDLMEILQEKSYDARLKTTTTISLRTEEVFRKASLIHYKVANSKKIIEPDEIKGLNSETAEEVSSDKVKAIFINSLRFRVEEITNDKLKQYASIPGGEAVQNAIENLQEDIKNFPSNVKAPSGLLEAVEEAIRIKNNKTTEEELGYGCGGCAIL